MDATARVHRGARWRGGVADGGTCAAWRIGMLETISADLNAANLGAFQ
jgi:hypothetical protein